MEPGWLRDLTLSIGLLCLNCCVTLDLLLAWLPPQPLQRCASMIAVLLCITAMQPLGLWQAPVHTLLRPAGMA